MKASDWLTPQIVSVMAGPPWTAQDVRDWIEDGDIKAARVTSKTGKMVRWLIHRSEAERFVRTARARRET